MFKCPGCDDVHGVNLGPGGWGFNGDNALPTFTPSILVTRNMATPPVTAENMDEYKRAPWSQTKVKQICHSFVTDGRIQFLNDCTHALAGQTVDLPDWK